MTELRFTRKAVEDLSDIWRYTVERWSEEQADRYYGLLVATCRKIAASTVPIGRRYEQIAEGLYGFRVGWVPERANCKICIRRAAAPV